MAAANRPHAFFTAGIVLLTVAGKLGDAFAPALVVEWPLLLLALNSNDLHCGLTSAAVPLGPWFLVTLLRRLAEDPLFFFVGWYYREAALDLVRNWSPGAAERITQAEDYFRRASYAAVVIEPGAIVCSLAGAARMSPTAFFALDIGGTSARLLLIRGLGALFPEPLQAALGFVESYQRWVLGVAVLLTALATWKLIRHPTHAPDQHQEGQSVQSVTKSHAQ